MNLDEHFLVLVLALLLDRIIGDPQWLWMRVPHPVAIFGKAIGDFQGNRWKLADMYKDIETGRSILYRACMTADPFPDPFEHAVRVTAVSRIAADAMTALLVAIFIEKPPIRDRLRWRLG